MTAQEALEKSFTNSKVDIEGVMEKIDKACSKGECSILITKEVISKTVEVYLIKLGYTVESYLVDFHTCYRVSWNLPINYKNE